MPEFGPISALDPKTFRPMHCRQGAVVKAQVSFRDCNAIRIIDVLSALAHISDETFLALNPKP